MKRLPKSLPTDEVEINVSPLIDMVFILLIFLLWRPRSSMKQVLLPSTGIPQKTHFPTNLLSFQLPSSGQLMQNGSVVGLEEIAQSCETPRGKVNL